MVNRRIKIALSLFALAISPAAAEPVQDDLTTSLRKSYPSLAYVDRFRAEYPEDIIGSDAAWRLDGTEPVISDAPGLVSALIGLSDPHVSLTGPKVGRTRTLGVLFRTSTDGHMIVWRVFDGGVDAVKPGDEIIGINGVATAEWLLKSQAVTFGGNSRSRQDLAALNLGIATPVLHQLVGIGDDVELTVRPLQGAVKSVRLAYRPMTEEFAFSMTAAVNQLDLPAVTRIGRYRVGNIRLGVFAPQYDPVFNQAAEAIPETPDNPDLPMLVGFCAVTKALIAEYDKIAARSDVMLIDLRGNLGGFGREARLISWALTRKAPPRTYDVFAGSKAGTVRLQTVHEDESCGQVKSTKPIVVMIDAGTRSAGELMAAWLWSSGATIIGERSIGAGGGREFGAKGVPVANSDYNAWFSGNFTIFDPKGQWQPGEIDEKQFVETVAADRFAPSRSRPFAIQAVGMKPDFELRTGLGDLRDGGKAALGRYFAKKHKSN